MEQPQILGKKGAIYSSPQKLAVAAHLGRSLRSGETGVSGLRFRRQSQAGDSGLSLRCDQESPV